MAATYSKTHAGCYVDASHGIYAIDRIVAFAEQHGGKVAECNKSNGHKHRETVFQSRFAGCEFAGEVEDEADAYMNENFSVEGAYWGRSEQGDWGLWVAEEEE